MRLRLRLRLATCWYERKYELQAVEAAFSNRSALHDDTSYLQFDLNLDKASALAALAGSKFRLGLELFVINALNCNPVVPSDGGGVIDDEVKSSGLWHAVTEVPVEFKNYFYQFSSACAKVATTPRPLTGAPRSAKRRPKAYRYLASALLATPLRLHS